MSRKPAAASRRSRTPSPLPPEFYLVSAAELAPRLLGKRLVRREGRVLLTGIIVETEAYVVGDVASHAFRGPTARNRSMFGSPGTAYVYQTRHHFCLNATSGPAGVGEAVLLRAVEPRAGIERMRRRRVVERDRDLCSGPAKLCVAFGVDKRFDGIDLTTTESGLWIDDDPSADDPPLGPITVTTRIGVRKETERPLRFYLSRSDSVSRR